MTSRTKASRLTTMSEPVPFAVSSSKSIGVRSRFVFVLRSGSTRASIATSALSHIAAAELSLEIRSYLDPGTLEIGPLTVSKTVSRANSWG